MASAGKRGRSDAFNGNGPAYGSKRPKAMESFQPGIGSKSKPCTKFYSIAGCPFGEGCHFLHYVPGGFNAVSQMTNLGNPAPAPPSRNPMLPPPGIPDGSPASAARTRMCNKYNTPEGCKFGDRCRFSHGERELGRPAAHASYERELGRPAAHASYERELGRPAAFAPYDDPFAGPMSGRRAGRYEQQPEPTGLAAASSFGASATAKISVDASLASGIIGKGGVNTKHICRTSGVKLAIRDHESDPKLRNVELEGTFDQIKQASAMVRELILQISATAPVPARSNPVVATTAAPTAATSSNFKTKLCDNFVRGTCTFGDRCHFAHGENELRKSAV